MKKEKKPKKERKPFDKQKLLKRLFIRLPIFIIVISLVVIFALRSIVRYEEPLRAGLEDYVSQISGTRASINSLDKIMFFPRVEIVFSDLTLHAGDNAADIKGSADKVEMASPFWTIVTPVKRFDDFTVRNAVFAKDYITPYEIKIDTLDVVTKEGPDQYGSFVEVVGDYGGHDMRLEIGIAQKGKHYYLPKMMPFVLTVGDVSVNANLVRGFTRQYFENMVLTIKDERSGVANYELFIDKEYNKETPFQCILDNIDQIENCRIYFENTEKEVSQ